MDVWGTEFEVKNDAAYGITVASAGPDREFSSEDDIISDWHVKTPVVYVDSPPEPPELLSIGKLWDKVKEKKSRWSFKWGSKDDEETETEEPLKESDPRQSTQNQEQPQARDK